MTIIRHGWIGYIVVGKIFYMASSQFKESQTEDMLQCEENGQIAPRST